MSSPPIQYAGVHISASVPWDVRVHLQALYSRAGNHTQAFSLLRQQISALKTTATTVETVGGFSGGGGGTFTQPIGTVNDQAGETSYSSQAGDYGSLIVFDDASPVAVTLSTEDPPWFCFMLNEGSGTVTLTPASGTINGSGTLALSQNSAAIVFFDGIDFWSLTIISGAGYTPQGGPTSGRPGSPILYEVYFDTTLGWPIWWTGSSWVNAGGLGPQ